MATACADLTEEIAESKAQPPITDNDDDDDLLDLLTEEDEDFLASITTPTHSVGPAPSEPLYHRLESPKTNSENIYHVLERPSSETESNNEDFALSSNVAYGTVGGANEEVGGANVEVGVDFTLSSNVAYGTVGGANMEVGVANGTVGGANVEVGVVKEAEPRYVYHVTATSPLQSETENVYNTPRTNAGVGITDKGDSPLYEQLDDIDHLYEHMDAIEMTDGGLLSRPSEEEEEPVFANLPPLVCAAHYGDRESLTKLSDTAGSVVKEAVKNIRKLLGEYLTFALTIHYLASYTPSITDTLILELCTFFFREFFVRVKVNTFKVTV